MSEDRELEYARAERARALNPSSFDKGFGEGDDNMGFGGDEEWGSFTSGGDSGGFGNDSGGFGGFGGDSGFGGGGFGGDSGFGGGFGGDSGFGGNSGGFDSGFGGGFGGGGFGGGFGSFGGQNQGQAPQQQDEGKAIEDVIGDGIVNGGKAVFDATKKIGTAAKDFNVFNMRGMGKQLLVTGAICSFTGIILALAKSDMVLNFVVSGLISMGIGVIVFTSAHEKIEDNNLTEPEKPVQSTQQSQPQVQAQQQQDSWGTGGFGDSGFGDSGFGDSGFGSSSSSSTTESSDDDWGDADSWGDDEDWGNFNEGSSEQTVTEEPTSSFGDDMGFDFSLDDVEETKPADVLDEVTYNNGVVTRQYIFEKMSKILPHVNKNFNTIEELDEDSSEFGVWLKHLNKAVDVLKPDADSKEAKPQLISVKKKTFYYLLEISVKGVKGIKPDALMEQLVSLFAYDVKTNKRNNNIYGSYDSIGGVYYIKIMRGESATVSIEDIMMAEKNYFLDTKNEMPCALGIDIDGDPILIDAATFDTLLITGVPRTGKSWAARSMLLQMMAFSSPEDVHFYILDPKECISDYNKMRLPHIKRFETTDSAVLDVLREVVRVEGPRRKEMLAQAGVYKIQEFREKNPTVSFPYLYVVIDEVVTLSGRMDKDTKNEFQGLLTELVTQLPATGIRLFMIPHVVKDDIIKKTITQNIPCRISVRGDAEHIETCTGLKPKDFPYKLNNVGDMAVNIKTKDGDLRNFVHSTVVATSAEKTDEAFDFVDGLWRKILNIDMDAELRVTKGSSNKTNRGMSVAQPTRQSVQQKSDAQFKPVVQATATKQVNPAEQFKPVVQAPVQEVFNYNTTSTDDTGDDDDLAIW